MCTRKYINASDVQSWYSVLDSTLEHRYIFNVKSGRFHARARAHSLIRLLIHSVSCTHKYTYIHTFIHGRPIRNQIEIETNIAKKIQLENLYEANSVCVMYRMILLPIHIHSALARAQSLTPHSTNTHTELTDNIRLSYIFQWSVCYVCE